MTPLFKKLNYKNQEEIIVLNAPQSFEWELSEMKANTAVFTRLEKVESVCFIMCFVTTQTEIADFFAAINPKLNGDTTIWVCYPKSSSKNYTCNFNRDNGFSSAGEYGLEPVRQVAIDNDWSGLRFRKVEYILKITRRESFALTPEAKKRTSNKGK
jgi:hypothetical protein